EGETATFTVVATGTEPIEYEWRFNSQVIEGASGPVLTVSNASKANEGSYQVVMKNPAGSAVSEEVKLTVVQPVVILGQPEGATKLLGQAQTLSVVASGSEPLEYQWSKDGQAIEGANAKELAFDSLATSDAASYSVSISNEAGTVVSDEVAITVHVPITITQQSVEARVIEGETATFTVVATGTEPIEYEWRFNSQVVAGVTGPVLTVANASKANEGSYQVVMKNPAGSAVSEEVKLTVVQPITITQQPVAEHVLRQDQSLLLEVVASGSQPISYQWHRDDVSVDGANSFRYEVANAKSEHTGQYKLVMSNEAGEVVSEPASVVVYEPVSFVELPGQVQVFPGETATFNVSTSGTEPIEYQWLYENQPLSGATRKTLTLNNVQESHTGKYRVVASNPAGKVTSPEVRLLILKPAVITTHPTGDVLRQGETLTMAVGASGTEPLHFEWKRDGQVLDEFTGSKVEISDVQLANGGTYTVTVSNEGGAVTSDEATVVVNVPITLVSEPKDRMVPTEASMTFEVEATGTEPLTYQWLKNGEPVAGATASTFIISGVSLDDSGGYQVLVTNPAGDQLSRSASLRVAQPVSIVTQPQSAQIREGQPYELSVLASGSEPISYKWYKNAEPVEGAVSPSLLIENAAEADGGAFHVVIGNEVGDLSSAEAIVEVLLPPSVGDLDELKEIYKGSTVSLTAPVSGYGTFNYQWLKNGVNIPGAIDKTLVLVNVTMQDSGSYSLNVGSEGGALYSNSMNFRVLTDGIELADAFSDAVQVSGANGEYRGSSAGATSETNEPPHGDRAASASVWMQWRAPGSGIATFDTKGSNFDTTLAVYTGETIEALQARAADADLGGYLTSKMRFNAVEGEVYSVAVDGFNGATGDVVLNWQLEVTSAVLPVITAQPQPTTGVVGLTAEFVVTLEVETGDIEYVWYKDDQLLAGETAKRLVFDEVAVSDNGVYAVQVTSGAESVMSEGAQLLIQFEEDAPDTEVNTKLDLGSFLTPGPTGGDTGGKEIEIILGGPDLLPRLIAKLRNIEKKPGEFSFSGATVYTTTGAAKDPGEPNHAGNTGGASAWTTFTPSEEGTAKLSTENSDFDTVLAIYKVGSGSGWDALEEVASDDNSGGDGEDSEGVFDVEEGATYLVAVDGVGGETGTVQLNHELSQTPVIDSVTESADGLLNGTVTLEVAASSPLADAELTYQWRRDGNLINGATAATLSLADLQYTDAGDYTVEVSSFAGDVTSDDIPVRVIQPVTIGTQPASVSGIVGGSVVLEISVTGTDPITYQWKHAGEDIEGGTDATLTLASLTEDSAGEYQAVVTNPAGSVLSDVATLTVEIPPVVATLTEDQNVIAGETVELSVTATGSQPMTYAWKRDGALIDGQTDASLTLPDIAGTDAGVYSVEITNSAGLTESDGVTVSVVQPVSIASQPEAATIVLGGSTLFQVAATGTEPITYQWSQDGTAIADATESTLTLTTVEASAGGEYKVTVTNAAGSVDSDMVTLTVESPPTITALAESMSLVEGDSVELLVTAVGTAPITYQWSKGGVALAGATGSTLSLSNVAPSDADDYKVAVSNGAGRVESDLITVTVAQPASIVSQPEGGQAVLGETFTLSVVAAGTEPLIYKWYRDGELIFGAGLASLTLADLGAIDSGTYRVAVQNLAGTVESDLVNLSVETPPEITQQPASLDVAVGGDITLSVAAIGSEPLAYQWSRDGVLLSGATGAELTLTGLEPSDAGSYTVSISNFAGLLVSDAAIINAIHPIVIAEQPSGSTKVLGETVTVAVAVTGSEPISYQWLHNGNEVAGANGSTIVLENLSAADAGQYRVRVSNPAGELLSQVALVLVDSPPEIVGLSGDQSAPVGGSVELTVEAVGNEPLAYQWAKDGVLLDGATSASLALANLDTTDSGSYTVVVTNAAGRLESDPIAVNVIQPVSIVLQPSPATAAIGGKVVFEVAVTGSTPVSYQWNLNGEPVADETAAKLVIDEVAALDGGTYTVTASNASNSVESDGAELTIQTPPIITKIAGDQQAAVGETVTLWVTAVGTPPLSYQWKREGVVIPGGTGDSLELSELVSLDAGQYTVEISNSAGSTVSDPIEVSVAAAPQIVGQPASKNIGLNARLILTVSATGSGIAYQWYRDGGAIEGATEAVLTVPNAGSADSGTYHVIVTNSVGSATSETAEVVVVAAPDILTQPEGGFAPLGGEFVMSVEAKGAGEVTYQWRVDGVVLEGRTQNVLNLTGLKLSDAGVYAVEVVNAAGITKSEEAEVQVLIPVSVIEQPQNQSVVARSLVMFEAVIGGSSPISYQWYFNGNPVAGAVEPSLRIENASNEHLGDYHLVASNPVSTVTSEAGTLVVNLPPTVASHPAGGTVTQGDDTTFVVEAAGTGPFTYKWQRDGEVIPGATGPALTLMDVDAGDDALYTVLVENPYGLVVSEPARLEVTLPVSITGQPADTHVALDGTLTLNVTAAGTGPFEYQWYRGDDKIEGAVEAEMQIPKMTRQKDGLYRVEVKNLLGALFSRKAEVVVDEPVSVTVQPAGATLLQGEEAVLWVLAKGSEPLSYQWQKDGVAIEGATGTSLTLSDAVEADEGNYSVIITNPVGFEVSAEALVKVNSPPTVESLDPVVTSVGDTLQVQVVADDADGDISKLRYVLRNQPAGMKISPSGLIEWSVSGEAEIKSHKVTIIVIDQSMLAASGRLTVRVNAAPAWEEIGLQTAVAGRELAFTPVLVDADDTEWSYATGDLPEGASFDPVEGFNWTPGLAQVGAHEVALTATDPHGASGTITVQIEVEANAAPAITPLEPVVVMGGGQLKVQVSANDPDGDNAKLKYKLQNAPVGMSISAGGLIEWTVPTDAPGGTLEVTVVAMDELSGPASILAVIVNLPPALTAVAPQTVSVGQALEIKPSAIDPEGGEVVFSARDLPTGAGFDPSTGFNWTPTADQLGVHEVVFVVNDPHGASDEETVIITVTLKPNTAPTLEALEPVVVTRGDTLSVQAVADDPDGDNAQLKYQLQDAPAGMTVSATGLIEWATGPETASGTMEVTVIVLDELESMSTGTLSVTVNLPPVLTAIGPQTVQAGQALAIKPSATDPNDADLVYTATDLPAGAVFEAKTGFRWTPADDQVGVHDVTFAVTDPHGAKASETVAVTVTEAPKAPPFVLLSSATVVGEFAEVTGATLDEDSKTFTVKRSGGMRFYRLRAAGETKPKILSIRLQDDNAVITFKPDGE
ncbi:MAG: hypothetical protein CMO43_12050, partial [Verrucomicrobiales bacterium]|nr:hypothetical protein [Verrucomicrobiales bacterium]